MSYTPKPGDSVKATLGDSVLYGEMTEFGDVLLDGSLGFLVMTDSTWTFEPWVKPVTFKPLTVLRLQKDALSFLLEESDELFRIEPLVYRTAEGAWFSTPGYEVEEWEDEDMAKLIAAGKAEMLFEGVDE